MISPLLRPLRGLPLSRALRLADGLKERMWSYCTIIEVAGSIRRLRPFVNDVDFVILPKSLVHQLELQERCSKTWGVVRSGEQNCIYEVPLTDGLLQVDIFFARLPSQDLFSITPTNFGSLLVCRTGSREHNIYLVEHAKRQGLKWDPYAGVFDGERLIASATEVEVFRALGLEMVMPERRER
jgi:DNA polymerase (family X)